MKLVTGVVFLVSVAAASALTRAAQAQSVPPDNLNLDKLPNFNYAGQDEAHKKSPCSLMFSAIQKDRWTNAQTQEISVETRNYPDSSFRLRFNLPRGLHALSPNTRADDVASYELSLSPSTSAARPTSSLKLRIQSSASDPSQIQEFLLTDTGSITGNPMTLILCRHVSAKAR